MEMEQLVSKITAEVLNNIRNQGGLSQAFTANSSAGNIAGMIDHTLLKQKPVKSRSKNSARKQENIIFVLYV